MRKLFNIFIIMLFSISIINCQQPKNISIEEIAVNYFADTIIKFYPEIKNLSFCYDGKVKTTSRYFDEPILTINTPKYNESVEFEKSYLETNKEDFEIRIPNVIKKMEWEEFQQNYNMNEYFMNVKHNIKSSKKILVQIDFYSNYLKEDPLFVEYYIFIDPISLRVIDYDVLESINPSPPELYINCDISFFGIVLEADGYKKYQPSGYTTIILKKPYMKFWIKESKNLLYEPNELKYFLKRNDSIVKHHKNDTLFIHRNDSAYYFILGKTINKKE